jgi:amino acid transporter
MTGPADPQAPPSASPTPPRLRRVLGLGDLVFYGIVLIQPVGAVGIFGLANKNSLGHVSTTILIALVAMMLTAVSYGRMAGLYPVAGSAYTYVGRGLNAHLGFIAGWSMFLDYLVIPIVSLIYAAKSAQSLIDDMFPTFGKGIMAGHSGYVLWVIFFTGVATFLNLRGIKWTARANLILTAIMFLVIGIFIIDAVHYLWVGQGWSGLLSTEPFYNPHTFNLKAVGTATSLAALTYIGFDGITTLAEDVREPKRTVPLAIVLVCLLIGLCAVLQTYLGQRVWPDYTTFKDMDTAFYEVCKQVGGRFLLNAMASTMAIACLGTALAGQVGAARILFGMGRDNALPRFFANLDKRNNPVLNIWIIGILVLAGSLTLKYEESADLVNWLIDLVVPGLGFLFCLWLWWQLPILAKKVGGSWCVLGLIYTGIKTRGFRRQPVMLDLSGA